jgi:hypothetical protein
MQVGGNSINIMQGLHIILIKILLILLKSYTEKGQFFFISNCTLVIHIHGG